MDLYYRRLCSLPVVRLTQAGAVTNLPEYKSIASPVPETYSPEGTERSAVTSGLLHVIIVWCLLIVVWCLLLPGCGWGSRGGRIDRCAPS